MIASESSKPWRAPSRTLGGASCNGAAYLPPTQSGAGIIPGATTVLHLKTRDCGDYFASEHPSRLAHGRKECHVDLSKNSTLSLLQQRVRRL